MGAYSETLFPLVEYQGEWISWEMDLLKPPRLKTGQLIGLVSPASAPSPPEKIEKSVRYLEKLGYRVRVGSNAGAQHGYLAGTDEQRAGDFNDMIRGDEVKAIFALRGGYGTPRILSRIDYGALRRSPKIISGFSDITALQLAIYSRCKLVTFSGPMPAVEFWKDPDPFSEENFWRLLTSKKKIGPLKNAPGAELSTILPGRAEGVLLGGNLALVASTVGTPFFPPLRGAVLVLEEVDEYPYRIDRMLAQLSNSRTAQSLGGLILGEFTRCEPKDPAQPRLSTAEVLREFAGRLGCPSVAGFQYGHVPRKLTVPFGLRAEVDAGRKRIEVLESAVS